MSIFSFGRSDANQNTSATTNNNTTQTQSNDNRVVGGAGAITSTGGGALTQTTTNNITGQPENLDFATHVVETAFSSIGKIANQFGTASVVGSSPGTGGGGGVMAAAPVSSLPKWLMPVGLAAVGLLVAVIVFKRKG